jgi:UDP-2,3-diacylglucosamine hydrolase
VLPGPCYIISDAHLGAAPAETERSLLAFLRYASTDAGSIVVNGDLFDFWFEWKYVLPRAGYRVFAALSGLADAGIPVVWVAGNHDCWGGDIIRQDGGIDYRLDGWRGSIAGWGARVEHGDGLRHVEDRRYRALRTVLRNRAAMWTFRWLHPDLGARLAVGSSHASRTYKAKDGGEGLRHVAHRDLEAEPSIDLVVFGHSHVPALERTATGQIYANAGTWIGDSTFLKVSDNEIALCRWSASEGIHQLIVLPRVAQ